MEYDKEIINSYSLPLNIKGINPKVIILTAYILQIINHFKGNCLTDEFIFEQLNKTQTHIAGIYGTDYPPLFYGQLTLNDVYTITSTLCDSSLLYGANEGESPKINGIYDGVSVNDFDKTMYGSMLAKNSFNKLN